MPEPKDDTALSERFPAELEARLQICRHKALELLPADMVPEPAGRWTPATELTLLNISANLLSAWQSQDLEAEVVELGNFIEEIAPEQPAPTTKRKPRERREDPVVFDGTKLPVPFLQERCQARGLPLPAYEINRAGGSDHVPLFSGSCTIEGVGSVELEGQLNRRDARQQLALKALRDLFGATT